MDAFSGFPDPFAGQNQFAGSPFSSGGDAVPLDLQTELKRLSLAPKPVSQAQQPQPSGFNPMALLGLGGLGLGGAAGTFGQGGQPDALTRSLPSLIGMTSLPAAIMSYLFRSGQGERLGQNLGEHVVMPIANAGGPLSPVSQLGGVTNTLLGGNAGNASANTLNLAQVAINARRNNLLDPHAMPFSTFSPDILRQAGATDAELRAWGVI